MIKKYDTSSLERPSKGEVRRAGEVLKKWMETRPKNLENVLDYADAFFTAQAWRSLHRYPLNTFQALLRSKLKRMGLPQLVAQRLKRMPTIINKLSRMQGTLETMQDIGGIRVVLPDITTLRAVEKELRASRFQHKLKGEKDYITIPKPDGYRGVHLVYQCFSSQSPQEVQGLTIELQLRTELQHYWATAVEAVDMFYGTSLKIGKKNKGWSDFFLTASAVFAHMEKTELPESCQKLTEAALRMKLHLLADKIKVIPAFEAMQKIAQSFRLSDDDKHYHLLCFYRTVQHGVHSVRFEHIPFTHAEEAEKVYEVMESRFRDTPDDVVLVSTKTKNLRTLYSNYLLNVDGFLKALKYAMA